MDSGPVVALAALLLLVLRLQPAVVALGLVEVVHLHVQRPVPAVLVVEGLGAALHVHKQRHAVPALAVRSC